MKIDATMWLCLSQLEAVSVKTQTRRDWVNREVAHLKWQVNAKDRFRQSGRRWKHILSQYTPEGDAGLRKPDY